MNFAWSMMIPLVDGIEFRDCIVAPLGQEGLSSGVLQLTSRET